MFRKLLAAALLALAWLSAGEALAQTATPFGATAGSGLNFCAYTVSSSDLVGCEVKYVWNGSAMVLEAADTSGHPIVDVYSLPNVTLGAGSSTIGAISNAAFGISGPLPAFAATPTFNLGALNGAATAANQTGVQSAPGASAGTAVTVQGAASGVPVPVSSALGTSGGWTPKLLSGLTASVVQVKSSSGQLGMLECYNPNGAQVYIQLLDAASPTLGTTVPVASIPVAPGATGGFALALVGIQFANAIQVAATTTATGSTAPTTAPDCNAVYK